MIRVASLNVHGADPRYRADLAMLLSAQDADLLGLQECPRGFAVDLARELGAPWEARWAPAAYLGNALLSRLPILESAALLLDGGFSEARSAACAVVEAPHGPLPVCCVHLDHRDASARLAQWAELCFQHPDLFDGLLCGDLNALTRSDYSDPAWAAIADERALSLWEPPASALMDAVARRGFRDAAEGAPFAGTCRFGTRIDYVLVGPGCPLLADGYDAIEAGPLTDHSLIVAALGDG